MTEKQILIMFLTIIMVYFAYRIFDRAIFPKIVWHDTKEIDRNPSWITSKLLGQYYGFNQIDIVLAECKWGMLPRVRQGEEKLELWVDADTSTKDVEEIGLLALSALLKVNYNLWFPDKPLYWLSILLFMLDGGDIEVKDKIKKQETS